MAKATAKLREIVQPIESVTVTLNQNELDTLMVILGRIGGCPDKSPRGYASSILMALQDATKNVRGRSELWEINDLVNDTGKYGAIYFNEYPEE